MSQSCIRPRPLSAHWPLQTEHLSLPIHAAPWQGMEPLGFPEMRLSRAPPIPRCRHCLQVKTTRDRCAGAALDTSGTEEFYRTLDSDTEGDSTGESESERANWTTTGLGMAVRTPNFAFASSLRL